MFKFRIFDKYALGHALRCCQLDQAKS